MEHSVIQKLKDGVARQRQNLTDWLRAAPREEQALRMGPAGIPAVVKRLDTLDNVLQKAEENTLGLCTVCHDYVDTSRLEMDYTACVCIEHLTGEERSVLESELELSQKVQRALLPHELPTIKGLEIAAFSRPAHIVGGDYFDFVRMADSSHAIVIADVMGKGMPASMLMASLQASLRIIAPESDRPSTIVRRLNAMFLHNIQLTKFVTFFIAVYDETSRTFTYVNAGHNPPLIVRADASIMPLAPTGAAIGLAEKGEFGEKSVRLDIGETLLLYTDGLIEAGKRGKEMFGQDRLESSVLLTRNSSPQHTISAIRERLQIFLRGGSPSDDLTLLAIRGT